MRNVNKIIHDEQTYAESVGKQDKETVREALDEQGENTVLRMCIGLSGSQMPVRVLGYFASALAIHGKYFPKAEMQFVYPDMITSVVNGVNHVASQEQASIADIEARRLFSGHLYADRPEQVKVKSFFDGGLPSYELEEAVSEVLTGQPELERIFDASASARASKYALYVAGHVLMHDTNPKLIPMRSSGRGQPADSNRARVISIGAKTERPFYLARMACQRAKILPPEMQVATGQIFTKHTIAPYFACREGEPLLAPGVINMPEDIEIVHPVSSVQRDLMYLEQILQSREGHIPSPSQFADSHPHTRIPTFKLHGVH